MIYATPENIISQIEQYALAHKLNHRFVGGVSFGGLLNEQTIADIFFDEHTIRLHKHNKNTFIREDKTIRDIDIILFCEDKKGINAFHHFLKNLKTTTLHPENFPDVSVEPTLYPSLGKRNPIAQFVTALEVDTKNNLFLTFEDITQQISWQSVEPWTVILENNFRFTVRNPIADYYAYLFRSPGGPKPKDIKKILHLKKLAETIISKGKEQQPAIDYLSKDYYGAWEAYIEKLHKTSNPLTNAKKFWIKLYWLTIGTPLAHNLSRYGSNFTGSKM